MALGAALSLVSTTASGQISLSTSTFSLLPDTAGQVFELSYDNAGPVDVTGIELALQVGDGASLETLEDGPNITATDVFTGTVFEGLNTLDTTLQSDEQLVSAGLLLNSGTVELPAGSGRLGLITLDTTGFTTVGQSWNFKLNDTLLGDSPSFFDDKANSLGITANDITMTVVPEPEAYAIAVGLGLVGFAAWSRRRRMATAQDQG